MNSLPARMEEVACPLCQNADGRLLFTVQDLLLGHPGTFGEVSCPDCGLLYLSPRPVQEDMGRFYTGDYAPHHKKPRPMKRASAPARLLDKLLFSRSDLRTRLKKDVYAGCKGRLLDVGCGAGSFLARMQSFGWQACGVEVDDAASRLAREHGLDVRTGTLEQAGFASGMFDVATAIHVLEHIHDPLAFAREIGRVLKPGGRLFLEVPSTESWTFRRFGPEWFPLEPPRHVCNYSPRPVRRLLDLSGFRVERIRHVSRSLGLKRSIAARRQARGQPPLACLEMKPVRRLLGVFTGILDLLGDGDLIRVDAVRAGA